MTTRSTVLTAAMHWATATTPPPASGALCADHAVVGDAAHVFMSATAANGDDVHGIAMALLINDTIVVTDAANAANTLSFRVTGDPVDAGTYVDIPVAYLSSGGAALTDALPVTVALTEASPPAPPPVANLGPDLVTVTEAATYLRVVVSTAQPEITDDLTRLVGMASDQIRDYLKARNDPTWTPTTAPPRVRDAVLLLVGNRWEHKGDDVDPRHDRDEGCWKAIERVLWRSRDPAWA